MGPLDAPRRVAMNQPTRALTSGSCNLPEHESSRFLTKKPKFKQLDQAARRDCSANGISPII